jgi:hypothetical protein
LSAGTTFLLAGIAVLLVNRRWLVALVALLDVAVIVAYFAMAGIRDPSFELWGLMVKAFQVVFLVTLGYMLLRQAPERTVLTGYSQQ